MQLLGFSTKYRAARLSGIKSNSRGSLILWATYFASILSWAKYESLMDADPFRVASSLFKIGLFQPTNTNLSFSFSRGEFSLGVRVASRFIEDEWCMSQEKLNVRAPSSVICPNSKHTVQHTEGFSRLNLRIQVFPCFRCVSAVQKTVDVFEPVVI